MRKLLIALSGTLLLTACQKEGSLETPGTGPGGGPGGNQGTGLLARSVFVAGNDSTAIDYGYDASKRLVTFRTTATDPDDNDFKRIVRNSAGIMTQFITKNNDLLSSGIDSLVTNVAYDNALSRYTYSITNIVEGGVTYIDSTAYNYDGTGNLTGKTGHLRVGNTPYLPYQQSQYTHASGNVLSEKYYAASSTGALALEQTYNYTYDNKENPVKLGAESLIVMDDASYFGNNNVSTFTVVDASSPSDVYSLNITYTYNSANKPSAATGVQMPGSGAFSLRYYYN